MAVLIAVLLILLLAALLFIILCRYVGSKFLKNLKRKNPGEKFSADIDVSFYSKGPLKPMAQKGLEYMQTLPHQEIYIKSRDGLRLHGTYFPAPGKEDKIVLGIHGFQSKAWNEYAPYIEFYRSLGFGMLLPDDRAHGLSEGEYISMGVNDRWDCISWASYIVSQFGEDTRILLHGVSMGAAAVLSASGEESLPEQVIGAVSDCGFSSLEDELSLQMGNIFHMRSRLPFMICRWYARHRAGFDFDEAPPIQQVRKARVPILFVQGARDFLVSRDMAERLYAACSSKKRLLMVEEASHAESIAVETDNYHRAIMEFFGLEPSEAL